MGHNGKLPSQTIQIADFITNASYDSLTEKTKQRLKVHVLDTIGCAIGALGSGPTNQIREYVKEFPARGRCTLIGGGKTSPDRAERRGRHFP